MGSPDNPAGAAPDGHLRPELLDAAVRLMGSSGKDGTLPVIGESMVPTIAPGGTVAVSFRPGRPTFGEIAVFRNPAPASGQPPLVVHRFLGRTRFDDGRLALRFRGDGVPWLDAKVEPDAVLGRVFAVRDTGGWWDLRGRGGRLYGRMAAAHDLFWSAVAVAARAFDRRILRSAGPVRPAALVAAVDRILLRTAHRLSFGVLHRRTRLDGDGTP